MSQTDPLCPIAHAACPARQRRMVQFISSLTLEPARYHGRAHLQRRLYLVPSMYNISMGGSDKPSCLSEMGEGARLRRPSHNSSSVLQSLKSSEAARNFEKRGLPGP